MKRLMLLFVLLAVPSYAEDIPRSCKIDHIEVRARSMGEACGTSGTLSFRAYYFTRGGAVINPAACPAGTVDSPTWGVTGHVIDLGFSGFQAAIRDLWPGDPVTLSIAVTQDGESFYAEETFTYMPPAGPVRIRR